MRLSSQSHSIASAGSGKLHLGLGRPGKQPKTLDSTQLGSVNWAKEASLALEREASEWETKTRKAVERRMDMFEWLCAQPNMRSYMKKTLTTGITWAPGHWRG